MDPYQNKNMVTKKNQLHPSKTSDCWVDYTEGSQSLFIPHLSTQIPSLNKDAGGIISKWKLSS